MLLCSSLHYHSNCTSYISFDIFLTSVGFYQVSLRDPLRCGAGDEELREIIGAAVCLLLNNIVFLDLLLEDILCFKNYYHAMQDTDKCALHMVMLIFLVSIFFMGFDSLNHWPVTSTIMLSFFGRGHCWSFVDFSRYRQLILSLFVLFLTSIIYIYINIFFFVGSG